MPKYVIEREISGAGKLSAEQLKGISQMDRDKLWIDWLNKYLKN